MAGDWIKMRVDLSTHPKVVRIASALEADRLRTVGALHVLWSTFDAHSEDGSLEGYSPTIMDQIIGWPGFCEAVAQVDWLEIGEGYMAVPEFATHNGHGAKRRAQDADRKAKVRKSSRRSTDSNQTSVPNVSASDADKKRTREEKSREEINTPLVVPPVGGTDDGLGDDDRFPIEATPIRRGYGTPRPGAVEAVNALRRHRQQNLGMATPSDQIAAYATRISRMMDASRVSAERVQAVADWLANGGDTGRLTVDDANRFCQHFAALEADMRRGPTGGGGGASRSGGAYGEPTMAELMAQRNTTFTIDEEDAP